MEMKWKGSHPRNVRELIWATNFRMAGLRGVSGEEGFLATALNVHFQTFGPEHWHLRARPQWLAQPTSGSGSSVVKRAYVREVVRRQALPAWVDNLWHDLCASRQVQVAANLGQHALKVAGSFPQPASSGVFLGRRAELDGELAKRNPQELPGEFWRRLGLPICLPAHLRPRGLRS